jgi:taurine dioxygenase
VNIVRIGGVIGAEIDGVDLNKLSVEDVRRIEAALGAHQVVAFRDQHLDDEAHLALARHLGELWRARAHGPSQSPVGYIENDATHPPAADLWHADSTFEANPPACGILRAEVVPAFGGDTVWASMVGVHDALSTPLQDALGRLCGEHVMTDEYVAAARSTGAAELSADIGLARRRSHPLVCRAAFSSRVAVFYNPRYVDRVAGVREEESRALCRLFDDLIAQPSLQFRWRWTPGDVVIWDQRATVHRGLSDHFHDGPQRRLVATARAVRSDAVPVAPRART